MEVYKNLNEDLFWVMISQTINLQYLLIIDVYILIINERYIRFSNLLKFDFKR